jgi:hypothetical protein
MAGLLTADVLADGLAVSVAQALAAANRCARDSGIHVLQSLITITQHASEDTILWRVNYGPRDYIGRRGGDLVVEVDPQDASIKRVIRGR